MGPRKKSLADELAELINPAPRQEHDPDALELGDGARLASDDEFAEEQRAPARRAPEKAMLLRGDITLEDAAYRGRRSSRAAVFGGDAEGEQDEDDDDGGDGAEDSDDSEGEGGEEEEEEEEDVDLDFEADDDEDEEEGTEEGAEEDAAAAAAAAAGGRGQQQRKQQRQQQRLDSDDPDGSDLDADEGDDGEGPAARRAAAAAAAAAAGPSKARAAPPASRKSGGQLGALEAEYEALEAEDEEQLATLRAKGERDRVKGVAVRNQQVLYERALEQRILLQKCLQASNGLPRPDTHALIAHAQPELYQGFQQLAAAARDTLAHLMELQRTLTARIPGVAMPPPPPQAQPEGRASAKRARDDADADAGSGDADGGAAAGGGEGLAALWERIGSHHAATASYRDAALDTWHRRAVLSSGGGALRNGGLRALNQSVSSQVAAIMRDPAKLIKRTRLVLSACPRVLCEPSTREQAAAADPLADAAAPAAAAAGGAAAAAPPPPHASASEAMDVLEEERDGETYDDSEFYQQLLKEFLDKGLADGAAAAPKAAKKRKQVDRRASKGRKIRYHVQDKLVAFMAPVDSEPPPFAANLFANLFGHARA